TATTAPSTTPAATGAASPGRPSAAMTATAVPTTPATPRRAASIRTTQPRAATGTPARPTTGAAGGGAWAARHPTATMGTSVRRTTAIRRRAASTRTTRRPVPTARSGRGTVRAEAAGAPASR